MESQTISIVFNLRNAKLHIIKAVKPCRQSNVLLLLIIHHDVDGYGTPTNLATPSITLDYKK